MTQPAGRIAGYCILVQNGDVNEVSHVQRFAEIPRRIMGDPFHLIGQLQIFRPLCLIPLFFRQALQFFDIIEPELLDTTRTMRAAS